MINNYFKTAIRNLFRNKIYSFINIAGLALGLACAMLIMLYVKDEVSYDKFHKNANQIYFIARKALKPDGSLAGSDAYTGYLQGPSFAAAIPEIQSFVRMQLGQKDMKTGTEIQSQFLYYVDTNFFSAFSFPLISGDPKTVLSQPNSIVISEDLAMKQFGTIDASGKTILLKDDDKFTPYLVSGVAKNCPQNSSIKFQALLPLKVSEADELNSEAWINYLLNTFVIINTHASLKDVETKIKKVYEADAKEALKLAAEKYGTKINTVFSLQPITSLHLTQDYRAYELSDASNPMFSYILSGIAIFVLLIACINFINLTIARSVKRAKEIGIRKVIGGDRKQLIIQFLGESFILCLIAFLSAVFLVLVALPLFNQLSNKGLSFSYLFDIKLVSGYLSLFIITSLLAGFYPAMILSNYNPVQILYSRFTLGGKNYLQKSLVVLQFALASFLIIATLTIFSQFSFLTNKKLGYDDSNLVVIDQWGINSEIINLFRHELISDPNIIGIAAKNAGWYNTSAKVSGQTEVPLVVETVDESFIPLIKVAVVNGRNFSADFSSDSSQSVLVNETFVKKAGWKNPIGQQVDFWYDGGKKYTVVGVVKDYYFQPLNEVIKPQLFSLKYGRGFGSLYIKIKPGTETASLQHIEKTFKKIFPLSPYSYAFKSQENMQSYETEAKWKQIILFGAVITIFISCIGLFGLSVLSAEKRIKEIGIRKVLGASVSSVVTILSKDFLKLVFIALIVSMPLSWIASSKWLENYPLRIAISWQLFVIAALFVILIALATVSLHAIKTAKANPVKSLKTE